MVVHLLNGPDKPDKRPVKLLATMIAGPSIEAGFRILYYIYVREAPNMKTLTTIHYFTVGGLLLLLSACSATQTSTSSATDQRSGGTELSERYQEYDSAVPINPTQTLISHLRRIPGLVIRGGSSDNYLIQVRGPRSIQRAGNESALYVINNIPVGTSYNQTESLIYMENVRAINVYRGGQAFRRYGSSAAYGVIEITTD